MNDFIKALNDKIIIFDGATGTHLQSQQLKAEHFGGAQYEGCNEYLCITYPEAVKKVHYDYLNAGADVIETNSFGATRLVLKEYNLEHLAYDLNKKAAQIARELADEFSAKSWKRFVAGSIGPGTKLPTLDHISYDELVDNYSEQISGLIDGGVDILCIETCQDILQIKAALFSAQKVFQEKGVQLPVIVSITIEQMGTMLVGTEIEAALNTIEAFDFVTAFGMNCAVGPKEMSSNIKVLANHSSKKIFVMPNAGIPENVGGKACYHLTPDEMEFWAEHFIKDYNVNIIGGCCGTTPKHIERLRKVADKYKPSERKFEKLTGVSSIYQFVPFNIDNPPLYIGERCNANGSKKFREYLLNDNIEGMLEVAQEQVAEGAHILDVSVAYVGRNEQEDMVKFLKQLRTIVQIPIMIDTTEINVMEAALKLLGGRSIINSVNLESGEDRLFKVFGLAKQFGAAVICLTIDEEGMAKTAEKKLQIAKRILQIAKNKFNLTEDDLIFDPLTFTLGSGDEEFRKSAIETLKAIKMIKEEIPGSRTMLGLSNVSFGLMPQARHALNSVFLYHAVQAGLDMAILHAGKIQPLNRIDAKVKELCEDLIFDRRRWSEE
ncbi:MAG TPA: homocysteine S-methyltransferase family protein [Ignavibacteriales bacterium]|nr:homocysteine S-methyltransferase family protein [Ignavibacteriales bacterium]HOL81804.1 homocysteine S-methyltransferase family protein [Ignavibacteriales bacterium]HOM65821.1 homocysteine S-methyltransferase family protein [Ignavibacteriales bacterium]HPD67076.1 homocysteine S-methyltransferase family protein [Ignavibacteriales bacterium]HPP33941.1 homocysteine S-methyltransferase family protein [Ignavibacteriales bacterium]